MIHLTPPPTPVKTMSSTEEGVQYGRGTPSMGMRVCRTDQSHDQYACGCAVQTRVCSTVQSQQHFGEGRASVRTTVCSTDLSHHQYGRECAVQISHIISTDKNVQVQDYEN